MLRKFKNLIHRGESQFANLIYKNPSNKLTLVAVTGTDGKTTTVSLIHHILSQAGIKCAVSSTLLSPHTTTPGRGALHRFLAQSLHNGCTHAVIEVTSLGIDQNRVYGLRFDVGVLTNIANNEHLDYHQTFENYQNTKINFLLKCQVIIANADDPSISLIKKDVSSRKTKKKLVTYAIQNKADITPQSVKFSSKLLGQFNTYNILAAIGAARVLGISDLIILDAIKNFEPPSGRLEIVIKKPFHVIVDFAHTPQAFEKVLPFAKTLLSSKKNKLIHVFGATGDRDRSKRPLMSSIASKFDDYIFLTSEDTYSENPQQILKALENGLRDSWFENYKIIQDRKEAIRRALDFASKGDVVILTGVGHQKSMNIGGKEIPWSEQKTVKELLNVR